VWRAGVFDRAGQTDQGGRGQVQADAHDRAAPEVMVKISGGGKKMGQIKAHLDYISRNGEVELEDENGAILRGVDDVREIRDAWAKGKIGIRNIYV